MMKRLKEFPGYFISDTGEVFCHLGKGNRDRRKHVPMYSLTPRYTKNGYARVCLREKKTGKRVDRYIHRLVAENYISNPENKPHVNHKNCDRSDNDVSNLEWVTPKENTDYTAKMGHIERDEKGRYRSKFQYKR